MQNVQERVDDDNESIARIESAKTEVLKTVAYTLLRQVYGITELRHVDVQLGVNFYEEVRRFEISLIKQALFHTNGKQAAAASLLKLNATTLHSKIKFYGIEMPSRSENNNVLTEIFSHSKRN
jgi:DNA-binding NtrC family response regulator